MKERVKIANFGKWSLDDFPTPTDFVKQLFDSKGVGAKEDYYDEADGRAFVGGAYKRSEGEKKKIIANAIAQLLDDPDYSCDAIPVAAELGLPEAKGWFLNLSKKSVEQLRVIKTSDFSNGLGCLILFSRRHPEFSSVLVDLIESKSLTNSETATVLMRLGELDPEGAIEKMTRHLPKILKHCSDIEGKTTLSFLSSSIFSKYGDNYCIDLAKRFKEKLPKEHQILFYKALEQNPTPRFKPYLEELKKILEI